MTPPETTTPEPNGSDAAPEPTPAPRRRVPWLVLLPLALFLALAGLFFSRLETGGDPSRIPSALLNKPAPAIPLPPLEGLKGPGGAPLPGLDLAALRGRPALVNVWASWCGPCRDEHPVLMELAKDGRFAVVGINYKDAPENARRFLGQHGLPYSVVGVDPKGRAAIEWGVYGVPETFVLSKDGTIVHKFTGPLTPETMRASLLPLMAKLAGG